jgi:Fe-S oxidoreductase
MGGMDVHCSIYASHIAKLSVTRERLVKTIENIEKYHLEKNHIEEIVCFHDECVGTFMSFAPAYGIDVPFKPIHLFEFLRDRLKTMKEEITPLNAKAAYQRPCSNRLYPKTDRFLDEICDLIGVERVARKYDRENALCCTAAVRAIRGDDEGNEVLKRNLDDMMEHEAEYCIFNCPFCYLSLEEVVSKCGMKPVMVSDLCRIAVGEEPTTVEALGEGFDLLSI